MNLEKQSCGCWQQRFNFIQRSGCTIYFSIRPDNVISAYTSGLLEAVAFLSFCSRGDDVMLNAIVTRKHGIVPVV